jgi:hypothetical protein
MEEVVEGYMSGCKSVHIIKAHRAKEERLGLERENGV